MKDLNIDDIKHIEKIRLCITISKPLVERLNDAVEKNGFEKSKVIEKAIENLLDIIERK